MPFEAASSTRSSSSNSWTNKDISLLMMQDNITEIDSDGDDTCVDRLPKKKVYRRQSMQPLSNSPLSPRSPGKCGKKKISYTKNNNNEVGNPTTRKLLDGLPPVPIHEEKKTRSSKIGKAINSVLRPSTERKHRRQQRRMSAPGAFAQELTHFMAPGCKVLSRPIAFADLVEKTVRSRCFYSVPRKSSLKTDNNETTSCAAGARSYRKKVSFATNVLTNDVWTMPKEIERYDPEGMWWNEEEMDDRHEQDQIVVTYIESQYSPLLSQAYKSTKASRHSTAPLSPDMVDLDVKDVILCSVARGLESSIIHQLRDMVLNAHYEAVFAEQQDQDCDWESICEASLKYSRPSRLVALKMAEIDAFQIELGTQEAL